MTAANWARTVAMARRMAVRLRELDVQVIEPPNFEIPPSRRRGLIESTPGVCLVDDGDPVAT